jgi:multidrug resistance efflux pump
MFETPRVRKRLSECEDQLEKLEGQYKTLKLEWENAYAKFLSIVQRISKQAQRVEQLAGAAEPDEVPPGPRPVLSRQEQLQAEILARRAKIAGGD